jgi:hypothetical protein
MTLSLSQKLKKQRDLSRRGLSGQYENTQTAIEFYNGDTMSYEDRIQFVTEYGERKRAMVQFNKIQPNVEAVGGFMAQNRRQAKYIARLNGSQEQNLYSKYMNALYDFHRENTNADQLETEQDIDMLINGYGAIDTDLSYVVGNATTDPNGEIIKVKLDPLRVGWDPTARGKNLLDARWAYYFEDYALTDALELFQSSKEDDFEKVSDTDAIDTGYVYNPWGGLYDKIKMDNSVEWTSESEDMVRVYNQQWFEYETFYRADNPLYIVDTPEDALFIQARLQIILGQIKDDYNGPEGMEVEDMFTFDPAAEILTFNAQTKKLLVAEFGDMIKPVAFKRKCFYTAVVSGTHVFTEFKSICQQGFSIKFKTGIYNSAANMWVGMVNAMMQPAEYHNKALTELMFTIAANSKGGVMVEEEAVEDIADFESKWAKTDAVIKVNSGALSGQKILQKTQGAVPTGLENIITLSDMAISNNGVDPSFMGNIEKIDQSGILFKRQIRQVISKFARYFDSVTLAQKEDARLCADLIRVWVQNNNGQWVRITGEDQQDEFLLINEDKMAAEYDVSIQEAPQTPEDKMETAAVLGTYADKLAATGNMAAASAFYAESLNNMPSLDADARNRLIKVLTPQDQIDPAMVQQLMAELEMYKSEEHQANVRKTLADAEYSKARADQTVANIAAIQAKVPQTQAQTVKTLEEARRTAAETDLADKASPENVNVSV